MGAKKRIRKSAVAATALGAFVASAGFAAIAPSAGATPVLRQVNVPNTDWTSAGVGGIGSGDTGTITIGGISGTVTGAWLTWNGIGDPSGSYNNPNVVLNGTPVTGTSQGESGSNCWGDAMTSRTYLADVKAIAKATVNGSYTISGLSTGGNANGAHLVVTYDDGNATNNRDLYLFYGNDSDASGFPGEDTVWHDVLDGLNYVGGQAFVQLAVSDGQDFGNPDDGAVSFTGAGGTTTFGDDASTGFLWDGASVPDMGHSRATNGSLYDLKTFDITGALGAPGVQNVTLDATLTNDCHAVTMAAVDLPVSGNQPPPPVTVSVSPASTTEGTSPLAQGKFTHLVFRVVLSARSTADQTVTLVTEDGTAGAPADYRPRTRTVTIPAGDRAATFKVNVVPDNVSESDEYMYAVIDSASVPITTGTAVGTIVDDDSGTTGPSVHGGTGSQGGISH